MCRCASHGVAQSQCQFAANHICAASLKALKALACSRRRAAGAGLLVGGPLGQAAARDQHPGTQRQQAVFAHSLHCAILAHSAHLWGDTYI